MLYRLSYEAGQVRVLKLSYYDNKLYKHSKETHNLLSTCSLNNRIVPVTFTLPTVSIWCTHIHQVHTVHFEDLLEWPQVCHRAAQKWGALHSCSCSWIAWHCFLGITWQWKFCSTWINCCCCCCCCCCAVRGMVSVAGWVWQGGTVQSAARWVWQGGTVSGRVSVAGWYCTVSSTVSVVGWYSQWFIHACMHAWWFTWVILKALTNFFSKAPQLDLLWPVQGQETI